MGVDLHLVLRVQLDLVRPLEHRGIDHHSAVEGVVLEAGMHVQFVAVRDDVLREATLRDELLLGGQVDGPTVPCALEEGRY